MEDLMYKKVYFSLSRCNVFPTEGWGLWYLMPLSTIFQLYRTRRKPLIFCWGCRCLSIYLLLSVSITLKLWVSFYTSAEVSLSATCDMSIVFTNNTDSNATTEILLIWFDLIFGVLMPLSTIFQLYHGDQF